MTIGLVYAMPGEIETLLTDETRTPIRTEAYKHFFFFWKSTIYPFFS